MGQERRIAYPPFLGRDRLITRTYEALPSGRLTSIDSVSGRYGGGPRLVTRTTSLTPPSLGLLQIRRYGILRGSFRSCRTTPAGKAGTYSQFTLRPKKRPSLVRLNFFQHIQVLTFAKVFRAI